MPLADFAKNLALDALDEGAANGAKYLSLHTAYSATGTSEVTGGSPAYARKAATWNAASAGAKALASDVVFDVPACSVAYIGIFDAVTSGNFLGMVPNGSAAPQLFALDDTAADTFKCPGHGFTADTPVVFWGPTLPTGVTAGTTYYVKGTGLNANYFQVTAAPGDGSAVAISAVGRGVVQRLVVEVFAAQGTFTVKAAGATALDLTAF